MLPKAGTRLKSAVCDTQVIVVKASTEDVDLTCGGQPLVSMDDTSAQVALEPGHDEGTLLGKRYADDATGLELLCTKPGKGSLWINGKPLGLKEAKPLPASD